MTGMPIGALARVTGLAPSAIRFYEKAGLLAKPARLSGQRRYGPEVVGRLRIVQLARDAGFTVAETRTFLTGFAATTTPAARWRSLAERKRAQIDIQMAGLSRMKQLLDSSFHCGCLRIDDCERIAASCASTPAPTPASSLPSRARTARSRKGPKSP